MFFTADNQTLYLTTWNYNSVLIIEALVKIIEDAGGTVQEYRPGYIVNRTIIEETQKARGNALRIRQLIANGKNPTQDAIREKAAANFDAIADELEKIPNDPRPVHNYNYVRFILDNTMYYVQLPDNPFFTDEYRMDKAPIDAAGTYSLDTASAPLDTSFVWDCFLSYREKPATDDDRKEAANLIYNQIIKAPNSRIIRDGRRTRVPNRYNNSYHYETIYKPERRRKASQW